MSTTQIFSDLMAKTLIDDLDNVHVFLYNTGKADKPKLILNNLLAIKNLRNYLDKVMRKNEIGGYVYEGINIED